MKHLLIGLMIGVAFSACSGFIIPELASRTLHIHDSGRLWYRYCVDKNLFRTKCVKWKEDFYDLHIEEERKKLAGFVCRRIDKGF